MGIHAQSSSNVAHEAHVRRLGQGHSSMLSREAQEDTQHVTHETCTKRATAKLPSPFFLDLLRGSSALRKFKGSVAMYSMKACTSKAVYTYYQMNPRTRDGTPHRVYLRPRHTVALWRHPRKLVRHAIQPENDDNTTRRSCSERWRCDPG